MKYMFIIVMSILFTRVSAQKYNCIIFIDGKMPYGITNSFFAFTDSLGNINRMNFDYHIGDIVLSNENNEILQNLKAEKSIEMHFTHEYKGLLKSYFGEIAVGWLDYDYLVIRITNLRKGEYYFAYSTPGVIKAWIKKEYKMIEDPYF